MKIYIFLLFIISLIKAEEENKKEEDKKIVLTEEEIDKYLFCASLFHYKIHKDEALIDEINKKLNTSSRDDAFNKVGSVILVKCFKNVPINTVRNYFSKGLYIKLINNTMHESFQEYYDIDYSEYKNKDDLLLTDEEYDSSLKFQKALEIYNNRTSKYNEELRKKEDKMKKEDLERGEYIRKDSERVKTIEKNLLNLPNYIKVIIFIIFFGAVFGGIISFLRFVNDKSKKKDKKKKKKVQ